MQLLRFSVLFAAILLVGLASADSFAVSGGGKQAVLGGYKPIKDLNDPHVLEIARFAVREHNKKSGSKLEFLRVVKGESQVVAGTNYRLVIEGKNGVVSKDYEAVVYERPWEKYVSLTSFKPVKM